LPEAQLDRFLAKIRIGYPSGEQEVQILQNIQNGFDSRELKKVGFETVSPEALMNARTEAAQVKVEPALFQYIAQLAARTRNWPSVSLGASPRAAISLMLFSKGMAAIDGRDFLIPDDVKAAALPILRHRLVLKPEADLEGITPDQVVRDVVKGVEVPK
jgi:MoxR-like ATPase